MKTLLSEILIWLQETTTVFTVIFNIPYLQDGRSGQQTVASQLLWVLEHEEEVEVTHKYANQFKDAPVTKCVVIGSFTQSTVQIKTHDTYIIAGNALYFTALDYFMPFNIITPPQHIALKTIP